MIVETAAGRLEGVRDGGALAFLGVPYGADTSGPRRFRPPVRPEAWTGVRAAGAFGPASPPTLTATDRRYFDRSALWPEYAGWDATTVFSEDCLRLNVWTPEADGGRRPVLVWLHGGGFSWGSGSSILTRGDALAARHDTVVVTLNHRLGVLGHLHHPEIDGSGVAGLLDLRLALEWVRDEIAAFGGDPGNVTIAGHSGGGAKVAGLLALPSARGLFHRAIIQSGVVSLRVIDLSEATVTAARVLAAADVRPVDVRKLQELPVDRLTRLAAPYRFRPVADGVELPAHPFDPVAVPTAAGLPLLIGTTAHDTATFKFDADPGWEAIGERRLVDLVANHPAAALGPAAEETVAAYRDRHPSFSPQELLVEITTDRLRERTRLLAERKLAGGDGDVFLYDFAYEAPMPADTFFAGRRMASHGLELPFVFDIADRCALAGERSDRIELAGRMSRAWAAFARHGSPTGPGLPDWPPYDPQRRTTMIFDADPREPWTTSASRPTQRSAPSR